MQCCQPTFSREMYFILKVINILKEHESYWAFKLIITSLKVIIIISYINFFLHFLSCTVFHWMDVAASFSMDFIFLFVSVVFMMLFKNIWEEKWNLDSFFFSSVFCQLLKLAAVCVLLQFSCMSIWKLVKKFLFQWGNPLSEIFFYWWYQRSILFGEECLIKACSSLWICICMNFFKWMT